MNESIKFRCAESKIVYYKTEIHSATHIYT